MMKKTLFPNVNEYLMSRNNIPQNKLFKAIVASVVIAVVIPLSLYLCLTGFAADILGRGSESFFKMQNKFRLLALGLFLLFLLFTIINVLMTMVFSKKIEERDKEYKEESQKLDNQLLIQHRELVQQEELLRKIAENYPNAYLSVIHKSGDDYIVGFTSGQLFKKMKLDPNQFVGMHCKDVFGENYPKVREQFDRTYLGKESYFELVVEGQQQVYRTVPLLDEKGQVESILSVAEDVSERKKVMEALLESENRWQFAIEGSGLGLWDWNLLDNQVYLSPGWKRMLGYKDDELESSFDSWESHIHPDDLKKAKNYIEHYLNGEIDNYEFEHRLRTKDGSYKKIYTRGKIISYTKEGKPKRIIGTHVDLTKEKELEERLRQSEKMQAIGQLAGGIAHDFNNQLSGIMGFADIISGMSEDKSKIKSNAEQIISAVERASKLTSQLLAFSRKGAYLKIPVDMNAVVDEVCHMLEHSIDKRIEIQQDLQAEKSTVIGDPTQLQNAILNIGLNARDAMPHGGTLTFSSGIASFDEPTLIDGSFTIQPGVYHKLDISDTGIGMDEETMGKIFEPFFTTKENGQGTGMGLAAVFGTLNTHNGAIDVISEVRGGTTFTIYLPLTDKCANRQSEETEPSKEVKGEGTILVIEDEPIIRNMLSLQLQHLGYKVLLAINGKEGVELFQEQADEVDLVILDILMPVMGGKEAFPLLKSIKGDVKVLISSGFSFDDDVQGLIDSGACGFLQKPYRPMTLSAKIAEILKG